MQREKRDAKHVILITQGPKMDDLDRLYNRLLDNIRSSYPEYMSRPFEVSELYQTLVPYRHNRRELQIDTNGDYEIALLRLLAGERGYLQGETAMHDMVKRELATSNPNSAIFREFAARQVSLGSDTSRTSAREEIRVEPVREQRPIREQAAELPYASDIPRHEEIPSRAQANPPRDYAFSSSIGSQATAPSSVTPPTPPPAVTNFSSPSPVSTQIPASAQSATSAPMSASAPTPTTQAAPAPPTRGPAPSGILGGQCRYCSGSLPSGRRTVYCPHCGQNLTIQRCPACATELEMGWKHCITCGRGVGGL